MKSIASISAKMYTAGDHGTRSAIVPGECTPQKKQATPSSSAQFSLLLRTTEHDPYCDLHNAGDNSGPLPPWGGPTTTNGDDPTPLPRTRHTSSLFHLAGASHKMAKPGHMPPATRFRRTQSTHTGLLKETNHEVIRTPKHPPGIQELARTGGRVRKETEQKTQACRPLRA